MSQSLAYPIQNQLVSSRKKYLLKNDQIQCQLSETGECKRTGGVIKSRQNYKQI